MISSQPLLDARKLEKARDRPLKVLAHGVDSMSRDVCRVQALSKGAAMMIRVSRLEQRGDCFRLVILRIK